MIRAWPLVALAACGRVGFDPLADPGIADAPIDTPSDQSMAGYPGPFDSLVVWYRMDDPTADGAVDDSGNGRTALRDGIGTPTLVTGVIGMAFEVPAQSYLRTIYDAGFETTTAFTIAFWVRPTLVEWAGVSKAVGPNTGNSYELGTNPMGEVQICTAVMLSFGMCSAGSTRPTLGSWSHLAVAWTGTDLLMYVAGAPTATFAKSGIVFDNHDLLIGAEEANGAIASTAAAAFDDVRIYNRALSAAEIASLATP